MSSLRDKIYNFHCEKNPLGRFLITICRLDMPDLLIVNTDYLSTFTEHYAPIWYNTNQVPKEGTETQEVTKELL